MRVCFLVLVFIRFLSLSMAQSEKEIQFKKNYDKRVTLSRIDDVYIPMNTEDAIKELIKLTEPEARAKLLTASEETIASKLHFSLGRWMLMNWGFEGGSRISHYYSLAGIQSNDDKIDFIIRSFYRHLANVELNEAELTKYYIQKQEAAAEARKKKAKVIETLGPTKKHNE